MGQRRRRPTFTPACIRRTGALAAGHASRAAKTFPKICSAEHRAQGSDSLLFDYSDEIRSKQMGNGSAMTATPDTPTLSSAKRTLLEKYLHGAGSQAESAPHP